MYYKSNDSNGSEIAAAVTTEPVSPSSPSQQHTGSVSRRRHTSTETPSYTDQQSGGAGGGPSSYFSANYSSVASAGSYYNTAAAAGATADALTANPNISSAAVLPSDGAPLSPYKAVHAAWAPTSNPANQNIRDPLSASTSAPDITKYTNNTLTACFWLPCWVVVFWGPADNRHELPLQIFWI